MKVLYLAPPRRTPDRLTAFSFVNEEIIGLARHGVEVYVPTYALQGASRVPPMPNVHLRELPPGRAWRERMRTLQFFWSARQFIPNENLLRPKFVYHMARIERFAADIVEREGIDVIHSNFGWPDGYGGMLTKAATGRPLMTTLRGMDVIVDKSINYGLRLGGAYDRAIRTLLATADRTTHVSDHIRRKAIELGAPTEAARTVRKGVDCEQFNPSNRSDTPVPTVMTVAGLIRRKGVDYIIRAMSKLQETHDFRLVIVGEGPESANLRSLAYEVGIESQVEFTGQVGRDRIQNLFGACDVFVLASIQEAAGNVVLEASASGCPIVCTNTGAAEYMVDGVTGFTVPSRDPKALADRIGQLLDDAALRQRMGAAAREFADKNHRYERMISDIIAVYHELTRTEVRRAA